MTSPMNAVDAWKRLAHCRRLQPDAMQVIVAADIVDALLEAPRELFPRPELTFDDVCPPRPPRPGGEAA